MFRMANRSDVPALTVDIAGPKATVSMVSWVKRPTEVYHGHPGMYGFLAGVWGDTSELQARQYAM